MLADHNHLIRTLAIEDGNAASAALSEAQALGQSIAASPTAQQRQTLDELDVQISIAADRQVTASYDAAKLASRLGLDAGNQTAGRAGLPIESSIMRRGHEMRLIVAQGAAAPVQRDGRLIALLIKAQAARKQLIDAEGSADASFSASHVARMARLAFLAPDIVAAILDGTQPPSLTARRLLRASELPLCWGEQRRMFGFG